MLEFNNAMVAFNAGRIFIVTATEDHKFKLTVVDTNGAEEPEFYETHHGAITAAQDIARQFSNIDKTIQEEFERWKENPDRPRTNTQEIQSYGEHWSEEDDESDPDDNDSFTETDDEDDEDDQDLTEEEMVDALICDLHSQTDELTIELQDPYIQNALAHSKETLEKLLELKKILDQVLQDR